MVSRWLVLFNAAAASIARAAPYDCWSTECGGGGSSSSSLSAAGAAADNRDTWLPSAPDGNVELTSLPEMSTVEEAQWTQSINSLESDDALSRPVISESGRESAPGDSASASSPVLLHIDLADLSTALFTAVANAVHVLASGHSRSSLMASTFDYSRLSSINALPEAPLTRNRLNASFVQYAAARTVSVTSSIGVIHVGTTLVSSSDRDTASLSLPSSTNSASGSAYKVRESPSSKWLSIASRRNVSEWVRTAPQSLAASSRASSFLDYGLLDSESSGTTGVSSFRQAQTLTLQEVSNAIAKAQGSDTETYADPQIWDKYTFDFPRIFTSRFKRESDDQSTAGDATFTSASSWPLPEEPSETLLDVQGLATMVVTKTLNDNYETVILSASDSNSPQRNADISVQTMGSVGDASGGHALETATGTGRAAEAPTTAHVTSVLGRLTDVTPALTSGTTTTISRATGAATAAILKMMSTIGQAIGGTSAGAAYSNRSTGASVAKSSTIGTLSTAATASKSVQGARDAVSVVSTPVVITSVPKSRSVTTGQAVAVGTPTASRLSTREEAATTIFGIGVHYFTGPYRLTSASRQPVLSNGTAERSASPALTGASTAAMETSRDLGGLDLSAVPDNCSDVGCAQYLSEDTTVAAGVTKAATPLVGQSRSTRRAGRLDTSTSTASEAEALKVAPFSLWWHYIVAIIGSTALGGLVLIAYLYRRLLLVKRPSSYREKSLNALLETSLAAADNLPRSDSNVTGPRSRNQSVTAVPQLTSKPEVKLGTSRSQVRRPVNSEPSAVTKSLASVEKVSKSSSHGKAVSRSATGKGTFAHDRVHRRHF